MVFRNLENQIFTCMGTHLLPIPAPFVFQITIAKRKVCTESCACLRLNRYIHNSSIRVSSNGNMNSYFIRRFQTHFRIQICVCTLGFEPDKFQRPMFVFQCRTIQSLLIISHSYLPKKKFKRFTNLPYEPLPQRLNLIIEKSHPKTLPRTSLNSPSTYLIPFLSTHHLFVL